MTLFLVGDASRLSDVGSGFTVRACARQTFDWWTESLLKCDRGGAGAAADESSVLGSHLIGGK